MINAVLMPTANGTPLKADFGGGITTISIQAYFDTGASGVLISRQTAEYLNVQLAKNGATPIVFSDIGVGGSENFEVSIPYHIGLAPYNDAIDTESPASYSQSFGPIRAQIAYAPDNPQLEGLDVFGMPVFAGKVVVINPQNANPYLPNGTPKDIFTLGHTNVNVYDPGTTYKPATLENDPGIPNVAHHVKLSYARFDRFTSVTPDAAAGPTLAHNPFVGPNPVLALETNPAPDATPPVTFGFEGKSTTGSFLLDTGASASMISKAKAAALSIRYRSGTETTAAPKLELFNPANPAALGTLLLDQFTIALGGVGGTKTLAGFYLDDLILKTMEGNAADNNDPLHMHYRGAPVLVNDISLADPLTGQTLTLDGILGMNLLAGSADISVGGALGIEIGAMANSPYDWIVFDEPNGTLGLAMAGETITAVPEPGIWYGAVGLLCVLLAHRIRK
ncbi:MAG: hypothetical protein QM811_21470 [Pirellulales bacterium]